MNTDSINSAVDRILSQNGADGITRISLYKYKGNEVLLTSIRACGGWSNVTDLDGNHLGAPWGGITGMGDRRLPDWKKEAVFVKRLYAKKGYE